ncbi:MAG: AmmeMemoRadiSam system radical SAM enzyme [archaeon]
MHEAMFYKKLSSEKVQCELCPRGCTITEGKKGFCRTRKNIGGTLYAITYGKPCSISVDPIEKKPLYHFHPGELTLSIATCGCNLACDFCQNWEISQADPEEMEVKEVSPAEIVAMAKAQNVKIISYTYTEPTVFYEYAYDTAKLAHEQGMFNVFVSNGMINTEPLKKISPYLDAMNLDLKAWDDAFYKKICHGMGLEPIKQTARNCKEFGIHLEVTNLIIPGFNDSEEKIKELVEFVKDELGTNVPIHFSRFFPHYKMSDVEPTSVEVVKRAGEIAEEMGMERVHLGNLPL